MLVLRYRLSLIHAVTVCMRSIFLKLPVASYTLVSKLIIIHLLALTFTHDSRERLRIKSSKKVSSFVELQRT